MKLPRFSTFLAVLAVPTLALAACDDDPFYIEWVSNPRSVVLYSIVTESDLPSAFDFVGRQRVLVEAPGATGNWDVVVGEGDGELVFLTPQQFGIESEAGLAPRPGLSLDEVETAPPREEFVTDDPVPVEEGSSYVIRTRRDRGGSFGLLCVFYGKFEVVEADAEAGVVRFLFDMNPRCEDTDLVPDQDESDEEEQDEEEEQDS